MSLSRLLLTLLCLPLWACLGDERCGEGQAFDEMRAVCVCEDSRVLEGNRCVTCPEGEVAAGSSCQCPEGTSRDTSSGSCVTTSAGLGASCSANQPCLVEGIDTCVETAVDAYCTSEGCASSADCEGGYACNSNESPAFCQRPPLGQGMPCQEDADCAGGEATFCEIYITNQCLVMGCVPDSCFDGWECCDLRPAGFDITLCTPEGECPV